MYSITTHTLATAYTFGAGVRAVGRALMNHPVRSCFKFHNNRNDALTEVVRPTNDVGYQAFVNAHARLVKLCEMHGQKDKLPTDASTQAILYALEPIFEAYGYVVVCADTRSSANPHKIPHKRMVLWSRKHGSVMNVRSCLLTRRGRNYDDAVAVIGLREHGITPDWDYVFEAQLYGTTLVAHYDDGVTEVDTHDSSSSKAFRRNFWAGAMRHDNAGYELCGTHRPKFEGYGRPVFFVRSGDWMKPSEPICLMDPTKNTVAMVPTDQCDLKYVTINRKKWNAVFRKYREDMAHGQSMYLSLSMMTAPTPAPVGGRGYAAKNVVSTARLEAWVVDTCVAHLTLNDWVVLVKTFGTNKRPEFDPEMFGAMLTEIEARGAIAVLQELREKKALGQAQTIVHETILVDTIFYLTKWCTNHLYQSDWYQTLAVAKHREDFISRMARSNGPAARYLPPTSDSAMRVVAAAFHVFWVLMAWIDIRKKDPLKQDFVHIVKKSQIITAADMGVVDLKPLEAGRVYGGAAVLANADGIKSPAIGHSPSVVSLLVNPNLYSVGPVETTGLFRDYYL